MLVGEIPLVQSPSFTDEIPGRTYTYLHGDIMTVSGANIILRWLYEGGFHRFFHGRPHHLLTLTSSQPRSSWTTSISNQSLRMDIHYDRIEETDVLMLPVLVLLEYS